MGLAKERNRGGNFGLVHSRHVAFSVMAGRALCDYDANIFNNYLVVRKVLWSAIG